MSRHYPPCLYSEANWCEIYHKRSFRSFDICGDTKLIESSECTSCYKQDSVRKEKIHSEAEQVVVPFPVADPGFHIGGADPWALLLGIVAHKQQKSADDNEATLTLKLMRSRVIRSLKQRVPVAPKNGPWSNKNVHREVNKCISSQW